MPIKIKPRSRKSDYSAIVTNISKSIVSFAVAFLASEPISATKGSATGINNLIDAAQAVYKDKSEDIEFTAWDIARSSYIAALALFISRLEFEAPPPQTVLQDLIAGLLDDYEQVAQTTKNEFSIDVLLFPLILPAFRQAASHIPREMMQLRPKSTIGGMRKGFEQALFEGIEITRNANPELFGRLSSVLTDEFSQNQDRRAAQLAHENFVISAFALRPIFGQESTGITVSDLYIKQRCIWYTLKTASAVDNKSPQHKDVNDRAFLSRERRKYVKVMHIDSMHQVLKRWIEQKIPGEGIRVVAGGPGSGKSTFARSFAVEVIDSGLYDVLFIPLQELEAKGSFESRLENLFKLRTELGFERVACPLMWLGKSTAGKPPPKPLLLICDGLDEIAPPESAEATNVTTDFIQSLNTWISNRNSGGCFAKALVLRRDISAKEAFGKLSIDDHALLIVGGLRPIDKSEEFIVKQKEGLVIDPLSLAGNDQRINYWEKWAEKFDLDASVVPMGLTPAASEETSLQELTAEPLLLYLLLWTDYLGDRWREAADNRNVVYEAIFRQIFVRDWGSGGVTSSCSPNRTVGGHIGTKELVEDEFFMLQEALGLASWPSGARTVTKSAFDRILKLYLAEDDYEDLMINTNISFKSVALQSYTRGADREDVGYEFVHKSIGEYLIGRGLVRLISNSFNELERRVTDERCSRVSIKIATFAHSGILTKEIDRFLRDQIRLDFDDKDQGRDVIQAKYIPTLNWLLRNMFPVHNIDYFGRELTAQFLDTAERRSMDVFWTFGQHLAQKCYELTDLLSDSDESWDHGPLKPAWPLHTSASSFIMRMLDRVHTAETARICTFDRINFSSQNLTDMSLGSVLYRTEDKITKPSEWLGFSASGSLFSKANFFSMYLRTANYESTKFVDCTFIGSKLVFAGLANALFFGCDMSEVDFSDSNLFRAKFINCQLEASIFYRNEASDALFEDCSFGAHRFEDELASHKTLYTAFNQTNLSGASFRSSQLGKTLFKDVQFDGAYLSRCDFSSSELILCRFEGANFDVVTFNSGQIAGNVELEARRNDIEIFDKAD
jgi:uncharacterized protein YjbI with pentapeptide repeats